MAPINKGTSGDFLTVIQAQEERVLVDRLREIGLDQYIELPQIAVMGDTSSGKSSLLSALSGVSFPSSDQLTTRCPTQLILSKAGTFCGRVRLLRYRGSGGSSTADDEAEEEAELLDMDDVPDTISRLTQRLVAEGQSISDDQIVIELSGPSLPNLTLTDLPGLVRTVGDHEDHDIIPRVRQLVNRYMKQERTIIIAVVPANVDMHNTEILQAAQEADPEGVRTIAVVTKVDLVDNGAEQAVHDLLLNKKKRMHLGFHAVKCRNQRELTNGLSIEQGWTNERNFFREHEYWRKLPSHIWGIERLTDRLVVILQDNIRRSLPKVIHEIDERTELAQQALAAMGSALDTEATRRHQFSKWANQYLQQMKAVMVGEYDVQGDNPLLTSAAARDENKRHVHQAKPVSDTRLRAVLHQKESCFEAAIQATKQLLQDDECDERKHERVAVGDKVQVLNGGQWYDCYEIVRCEGPEIQCRELPDEWLGATRWKLRPLHELKKFIQANRGDELAIFPSYRVFCNLFRQFVEQWAQPTMVLVKEYRQQTKLVSDQIIADLQALSRVEQYVKSCANDVLATLSANAAQLIKALLHDESRPYTHDTNLFTGVDELRFSRLKDQFNLAMPAANDEDSLIAASDVMHLLKTLALWNEDREAFEMKIALEVYLDVAVRRVVDTIPMRVNGLMLDKFLPAMERELLGTTDEKLTRLMQDSERNKAMRQQLQHEIKCLREAKLELEAC